MIFRQIANHAPRFRLPGIPSENQRASGCRVRARQQHLDERRLPRAVRTQQPERAALLPRAEKDYPRPASRAWSSAVYRPLSVLRIRWRRSRFVLRTIRCLERRSSDNIMNSCASTRTSTTGTSTAFNYFWMNEGHPDHPQAELPSGRSEADLRTEPDRWLRAGAGQPHDGRDLVVARDWPRSGAAAFLAWWPGST